MDILVFVYDKLSYKSEMVKAIKHFGIIESRQAAMMPGKLYKCTRKLIAAAEPKRMGQYVYGFLYKIKGEAEVLKCLDGYEGSSKSILGIDHALDLMHRKAVKATVISFDSPDMFLSGKFSLGESFECHAYFGNINHYRLQRSFGDARNYIGSLTNDFFTAYYET